MTKAKKPTKIEILRDGVFVGPDVRKETGDIVSGLAEAVIETLIANGHAKRI